jgi:hypothetical protein
MARCTVALNSGGSSVKAVGTIVAAASSMRRAKIVDWLIGCSTAPADNVFTHIIQQCTVGATGTSKTPAMNDQADTLASTLVVKDTVTADGTYTAGAFYGNVPVNQRSSFRWVAAPYMELFIPATASTGLMFGVSSATTTTFGYSVAMEEM